MLDVSVFTDDKQSFFQSFVFPLFPLVRNETLYSFFNFLVRAYCRGVQSRDLVWVAYFQSYVSTISSNVPQTFKSYVPTNMIKTFFSVTHGFDKTVKIGGRMQSSPYESH